MGEHPIICANLQQHYTHSLPPVPPILCCTSSSLPFCASPSPPPLPLIPPYMQPLCRHVRAGAQRPAPAAHWRRGGEGRAGGDGGQPHRGPERAAAVSGSSSSRSQGFERGGGGRVAGGASCWPLRLCTWLPGCCPPLLRVLLCMQLSAWYSAVVLIQVASLRWRALPSAQPLLALPSYSWHGLMSPPTTQPPLPCPRPAAALCIT